MIATRGPGRLPIKREQVRIAELLERVRRGSRHAPPTAGRAIRTGSSAAATCAELDPLRIEQALGNLVDNALRHGAGDVSIDGRAGDGVLRWCSSATRGRASPTTSPSAPSSASARSATGRGGSGAGLGLSIVRAIAEAHGGEARIESRRPAAVRVTFR